jgi:ribose-phosphate pyrophosphokinase
MQAVIIPGSNSLNISKRVSLTKNIPIINKVVRRFRDSELYVRLEDTSEIKGKHVYIIHTFFPSPNDSLIELLLTIDAVKDYAPTKVSLIIPYFVYARQDKRFQDGEAVSLKTLISIFKHLGINDIMAVDTHFCRKPGVFNFYGIKIKNVTAVPLLIDHIMAELGLNEFVLVGPDAGSRIFLSSVSFQKMFLKKEKICPHCGSAARACKCTGKKKEYKIRINVKDLKNKNVIILDDIISSGGTILAAIEAIRPMTKTIAVGCTHGLFLGKSLKKLKSLCDLVVSTDTIKSPASAVSVAPVIAENL